MAFRTFWTALVALPLLWFALGAQAHEVRPAYLELIQKPGQRLDVIFKQPSTATLAVRLDPDISGGVLQQLTPRISDGLGFQTRRWNDLKLGEQGLGGRVITIAGLERSITDTLLVVRYADGHVRQELIKPAHNRVELDVRGDSLPIRTYVHLGIEHILTGYDHLLFVLGLILLVSGTVPLLKTITAFTVAHSITLALTALNVLHVNSANIEAMVALSIVFLGLELARLRQGRESLTQRWPWIIAFAFGLLHGSAFAGALAEIGLPQDNIPVALFLFNVGVELGQLLFVAVVLSLMTAWRRGVPSLHLRLQPVLQYNAWPIGILATYWFFERTHTAIGI